MKFIHHFGKHSDIKNYDKNFLGNKGSNLAEIANLGFNVPEGFIISSNLCRYYYNHGKTLPELFEQNLAEGIGQLEKQSGKIFGDSINPLFISVRSGAAISMPGMMETILNVGMNDKTCAALSTTTNLKFALDSYRRFLHMYGITALGIPPYLFDKYIKSYDIDLAKIDDLHKTIEALKVIIENYADPEQYSNVHNQLRNSVSAVLNSWTFEKAITYRKIYQIPEDLGTAVIVQRMVFGNMNNQSGTGVAFSRNPTNGDNKLWGEFLLSAQGEDIVSGTLNPKSIDNSCDSDSMSNKIHHAYQELKISALKLENHFRDMQDIEFTVEDGTLYILQTRSGKRSLVSAIKIATDMAQEKLISKTEAIQRITPDSLSQLMHQFVNYSQETQVIGRGLGASPGAACGIIAFTSDEAEKISAYSNAILVRHETSPEDIRGMHASSGILTSKGGLTSHAAVIARGMGKPCVSGANFDIDLENRLIIIGQTTIRENQYITIDGSNGNIILGQAELTGQEFSDEFAIFMSWVDEFRRLKVRANAESVLDIQSAIRFGAEGIGLCRTEHMLFEQRRLRLIRQIIITTNLERKACYIDELFELHKQDFKEIFALMPNLPINVRLFDPPLHEFLPKDDFENIAKELNIQEKDLISILSKIGEKNPMLGHRGCRLGITCPELYEMQIRAIFQAAIELKCDSAISFDLEIMLPLIATEQELIILTDLIKKTASMVQQSFNTELKYKIGTMIELPRAAMLADHLAKHVDYFSFGTNDLTQTTYGISRDDMASFANLYKDMGIFPEDPFVTLDQQGVGKLIKIACKKGKRANPKLSLSICGEHGGDPKSIDFCNNIGLNYVSCSPFSIIIAKLAAAQAAIKSI
jgi:pyruvate,orthophosphate dikinase